MNLEEFFKTKLPIVEIFTSISGEGISAGEVVTFVRTAGCNLRCAYCDTTYSYEEDGENNEYLTPHEIVERIKSVGALKVLCTGGEPLEMKKNKRWLPLYLAAEGFDVRIETNGSCSLYNEKELSSFSTISRSSLHYVLDIKCPGSKMSNKNIFEDNFSKLTLGDELKFVVSNFEDIQYALNIIDKYKEFFKNEKIVINFSPVFNSIDSKDLVQMLVEKNPYFLSQNLKVRLSLQIHKIIWAPEARGV